MCPLASKTAAFTCAESKGNFTFYKYALTYFITEEIQESHLGISLFKLITELKMYLWSHSVFHESQKKVVSLLISLCLPENRV